MNATLVTCAQRCPCQHIEAIHCIALQEGVPFYLAMGLGHRCPCTCHTPTDAAMVANFREFLTTVDMLRIVASPSEKEQETR